MSKYPVANIDIELLRVSEAAELLAVSPSYIYLLIQRNELPAVRIGRLKRIKRTDIQAFVNANLTSSVRLEIDYNDL